jgi:hypothetical protein
VTCAERGGESGETPCGYGANRAVRPAICVSSTRNSPGDNVGTTDRRVVPMNQLLDLREKVTVSLSIDDWAEVVAAVGTSGCSFHTKERVNAAIFDSAKGTKRTLS